MSRKHTHTHAPTQTNKAYPREGKRSFRPFPSDRQESSIPVLWEDKRTRLGTRVLTDNISKQTQGNRAQKTYSAQEHVAKMPPFDWPDHVPSTAARERTLLPSGSSLRKMSTVSVPCSRLKRPGQPSYTARWDRPSGRYFVGGHKGQLFPFGLFAKAARHRPHQTRHRTTVEVAGTNG